MKSLMTKLSLVASIAALSCSCCGEPQMPTADEVLKVSKKVADWQIEHFDNQVPYRAVRSDLRPEEIKEYHNLVWHNAAFYAGLYKFAVVANDDKYFDWLKAMGDKHSWNLHEREFHADDHAVGQFYLEMARKYDDKSMYAPTQARFDGIMNGEKADVWHWTWCDALYMAPPVWARLAQITGDQKYLEYMDKQYHMTYDILWNKTDHLFSRDKKFLTKKEKNGKPMYWARGNGWVFGGLALMIPDFPANWSGKEFYVTLFKEMAAELKSIQREDGTWSAGLLGDVADYENIETSGSSFYTFGFAWGINNGILDRETYEPVLLKAWAAMSGAVAEDGMLQYVQGVAAAPGGSVKDRTEVYGSGAFLAAGAEMYRYVNKFGAEK